MNSQKALVALFVLFPMLLYTGDQEPEDYVGLNLVG